MKTKWFRVLLSILVVAAGWPRTGSAGGMEEEFLFADFGEMPGMLTRATRGTAPITVTTITEEDIRLTPARNILDLLDVYVPNATWIYHDTSPKAVIRGFNGHRNDKYLLLVNGVKHMQMTSDGAVDEMLHWDLSDIQKIDVIRGPGSVIYGPGAVAGVISITTKNGANVEKGLKASGRLVDTYGMNTYNVSYAGGDPLKADLYLFASRTTGFGAYPDLYSDGPIPPGGTDRNRAFTGNSGNRFGGESQGFGGGTNRFLRKNPLMGNIYDKPEYKFHVQTTFLNDFTFWARYTSAGQYDPTSGGSRFDAAGANGNFINKPNIGNLFQAYTAVLENNHTFSPALSSKATVGRSSHNRIKTGNYALTGGSPSAQIGQFSIAANADRLFAFTTDFAKGVLTLAPSQSFELAAGAEISHDTTGHAWGKTKRQFRAGEGGRLISGFDSERSQDVNNTDFVHVGDGKWSVSNFAYMGEVNLKLHPLFNFIYSARVDDNEYIPQLYSPRVALVSDVQDVGLFKLIIQKTNRMLLYDALLRRQVRNESREHETLRGVEIVATPYLENRDLLVTATTFLDKTDVVGVTGNSTTKVGDQTLYGIELEGTYTRPKVRMGFSHAYTKQYEFKAKANALNNNIGVSSFQRTNNDSGGQFTYTFNSEGNDLVRFPTQMTKTYANVKMGKTVTWHTDARVMWAYQGNKDMAEMIRRGNQNGTGTSTTWDSTERPRYDEWMRQMNSLDVNEMDLRVNMSVAMDFHPVTLTLYAQNLFVLGGNYHYNTELLAASFYNTAWLKPIRDPRMIGIQLDYRLGGE